MTITFTNKDMEYLVQLLNAEEQQILRYSGMDGGPILSLEEISTNMGITREAARQLRITANAHFRAEFEQRYELQQLTEYLERESLLTAAERQQRLAVEQQRLVAAQQRKQAIKEALVGHAAQTVPLTDTLYRPRQHDTTINNQERGN